MRAPDRGDHGPAPQARRPSFFPALLCLAASITAPARAQGPVNLLTAVPAQVVVSSVSSPGMSGPSRMVDGRLDTAWNSRSGDLVGAWVAVSLPADAQVTGLRLVPGYLRNYQGVEQWERNHRIRRIAVWHDGAPVGEFDLDPSRPEAQAIAVSGGGGLWRIEVRETVAGSVARYQEACITELEVLGTPGGTRLPAPAAPQARVATIAGDGAGPRVAGAGRTRTSTYALAESYGGIATGEVDPGEAAVLPLVQQSHVAPVRVRRVLERGARGADRVLYVFYYLHPAEEERMRERMERRQRGRYRDEGCEDEAAVCPSLRLARVSLPREGLPVVDADVELTADACDESSEVVARDLDADGLEELRVTTRWNTHPVCPIGTSAAGREWIFDERTLRIELTVELFATSGAECGLRSTRRRRVRDLDRDGHPDFEVRWTSEEGCRDSGDHQVGRGVELFRYDPATDAWTPAPPP